MIAALQGPQGKAGEWPDGTLGPSFPNLGPSPVFCLDRRPTQWPLPSYCHECEWPLRIFTSGANLSTCVMFRRVRGMEPVMSLVPPNTAYGSGRMVKLSTRRVCDTSYKELSMIDKKSSCATSQSWSAIRPAELIFTDRATAVSHGFKTFLRTWRRLGTVMLWASRKQKL